MKETLEELQSTIHFRELELENLKSAQRDNEVRAGLLIVLCEFHYYIFNCLRGLGERCCCVDETSTMDASYPN